MVGRHLHSNSRRGLLVLLALWFPLPSAVADDAQPDVESSDPAFADPAPLNQAKPIRRTLEQIEALADSGRMVEAVQAWQSRLDGIAGDGPFARRASLRSLRFQPDWLQRTHLEEGTYARYSALRSQLEAAILARPPDDRETYDRETGPVARRLWERYRESGDPALLESLVERFLCGSQGPKAALQLATVYLERGDPGQAAETLERLLRLPDLGDAVVELATRRLRLARDRTAQLTPVDPGVGTNGATTIPWTGFLGGSDGRRTGTSVTESHLAEILTDRWSHPVDVRPIDVAPAGLDVGLPQETQPSGHPQWQRIARSWREYGRPPTTTAVESDGLFVFSGEERLVAVDSATGRVRWMGRRHLRTVEPSVRQFNSRRTRFGIAKKTPPDDDTLRFFDRVPGSVAARDGRLFVVTGRALRNSGGASKTPVTTNSTRRVRANRLECYALRTGKQLWARDAGVPDERFDDVGFLGAPLPLEGRVLAPVSEGGEVWLQAMSPEDGRTLWRTLLCDEPPGGCSAWSPVRVVAAGSRVYVLPGTGAVFCLAARSGTLEWAVRYDRASILSLTAAERAAARYPLLDFVGWEEDGLVAVGRYLLLLPSDVDRLVCLDRHEGKLLWDAPAEPPGAAPARELLGTLGDRVVVAGSEVVRCHEITTGRIVWEKTVSGVTGRGLVTTDLVFVPTDERLLAFDVRTGLPRYESTYLTPSRVPLGNLLATHTGLVSIGATHVVALGPMQVELENLAQRVGQGDVTAMLDRARLFHRLERHDEAFADVRQAAHAVARDKSIPLARRILEIAGEFDLATSHPREMLELAVADKVLGAFVTEDDPAFRDRWNELVYDCVATVGRNQVGGSTEFVLRVFDLSDDEHLLQASTTVLATTASPADLELLRRAADDSRSPVRRLAAIRALESPSIEGVETELVQMLDDDDTDVRLAAATALVNRGDRRGLAGLVDALESPEVTTQKTALARLHGAVDARFGFVASLDADARRDAIGAWRTWLGENAGEVLDLDRPLARTRLLRGRTLVANSRTGHVVEYDRTGRERWRAKVVSARDVHGTEDGRRVAVSYTNRSISVFAAGDAQPGTVEGPAEPVRRQEGLEGRPYSVRELPNGHLLVSLWDKGAVHEIDQKGQVVWKASLQGSIADARRLQNGHTLVTWYSQNTVVELDRDGKIVEGTRLGDMQGPRSAQRLANGNTLVSQYRKGRVVEVDRRGQVVWSHEGVSGIQHAQRLPNGNTLIVHRTAVVEVRRDGSLVWELPEAGVARVDRY